jgi:hypothetical protein
VALLAVFNRHQNFHRMRARRDSVGRKDTRILSDLVGQHRPVMMEHLPANDDAIVASLKMVSDRLAW